MGRNDRVQGSGRFSGRTAVGLILLAVLTGATGLDCDDDFLTTFRREVSDDIGEGLKTIFSGIVDALVAAVQSLGRGGS